MHHRITHRGSLSQAASARPLDGWLAAGWLRRPGQTAAAESPCLLHASRRLSFLLVLLPRSYRLLPAGARARQRASVVAGRNVWRKRSRWLGLSLAASPTGFRARSKQTPASFPSPNATGCRSLGVMCTTLEGSRVVLSELTTL